MIFIYSRGICGENDFRRSGPRGAGLPAGKARGHQVEKSRYVLDMEGFWLRDKFRIIADCVLASLMLSRGEAMRSVLNNLAKMGIA